jgi:hypothetical protein
MRAAFSLTAVFAIGIIAIWLASCAGKSDNGPTILAGMGTPADETGTGSSDPRLEALDAEGPILLPYRGPGSGGVAYRLTLEVEGERAARNVADNEPKPPIREKSELEAVFRKLPVEDPKSGGDMFLVGLNGLLYTRKQQNPQAESITELADDRLRVTLNGETSIDNRGNRVVGPLAPRMLLNRIFGVITHDPSGNPTKLSSRGAPFARQFMNDIPLLGAIAYAMVTLPQDPITPGSRWTGTRIPPSRSGEIGVSLTIDYTLAGFELFEDVPCAMILLGARINESDFTSLTGQKLDRVKGTLSGTAWVELKNSRVRRVVVSDQIKASWSDPGDPKTATQRRMEYKSKLVLALRDPKAKSDEWSDGTPHFDQR